MKKVTAFIMATAMLVSAGKVIAADSSKKFEQKIYEMQEYGIVDKEDDLKLGETLTRAQATKLICSAVGIGGEGTMDSDISYSDVTDFHWAYPYIMSATAMSITDGYEDGTFRPENQVTAREFVKMLVCAVGYNVYAEQTGGYPKGYMSYGEKLGITKGVEFSDIEPINRETAFELLYNTLDVPLLVINGYGFANGIAVPTYKVRDGEDFCSLRMNLTDNITK